MLTLLLECAARAVLIAAATAGVLIALRVKSAAARHTAWLAVVAWMLALPAWILLVPKASLRVLPAAPTTQIIQLPVVTAHAVAPFVLPAPMPPPARPAFDWLLAIYLLGSSVLLVRLAIGAVRAQALIRSARLTDGQWSSTLCSAPVTVGWLHPKVILPDNWGEWPAARLAIVEAHEREHVRRRDPLTQFLALLNRAVFWFHPVSWWLERRLSVLAEDSCDAAVLSSGHDPYDYSQCLLEIARTVERSGARIDALAMAMPGTSLPARIRRILSTPPAPPLTRPRTVFAAMACLLLSAAFAAGALDHARPQPIAIHPIVAQIQAAIERAPAPAPVPVQEQRKSDTAPAAAPAPTARRLVIYFDTSVVDPADQARAVAMAQNLVVGRLQTTDLVAVMVRTAGALKITQDFTADHDLVRKALAQLPAGSGQPNPDQFVAGLQTAVHMLSTLEGKKSVVYFSRGALPASDARQALINDAVRANVAFYAIDTQGLAGKPQEPQEPAPQFEVASIKPEPVFAAGGGRGPGRSGRPGTRGDAAPPGISVPDPNRVIGRGASLRDAIEFAYGVQSYQVIGPDWLDSGRYTIDARSSAAASDERLRQMMQSLLAARFHLAFHREKRDLPILEMTVAPGGIKAPEVKEGEDPATRQNLPGGCPCMLIAGTPATLADVVTKLAGLDRPVVDRTGLATKYHFNLHTEPGEDLIPPMQAAFGLKFTPKKDATEILVVDQADRVPVEN